MSTNYRQNQFKRTLLVLSLFAIVAVIAVAYFPSAQTWLLEWSGVLSGGGSVLLSALLVVLYQQQMGLLAAEQRPVVEVEDDWAENKNIFLKLSNYGKGVATNTELVVVSVLTGAEHFDSGISVRRLTRKPDSSEERRRGQSIKGSEDLVLFEAQPAIGLCRRSSSEMDRTTLRYPNEDTTDYAFGTALSELGKDDTDIIRLHFYLRYNDVLEKRRLKYIRGIELDGDAGDISVEEAYDTGGPMLYGEPTVADPDLELDLSDALKSDERTVV